MRKHPYPHFAGIHTTIIALMLLAASLCLEAQGTDSVQSWTSSDGRVIQAKFLRLDGEAVVIERDGKSITVAFEKLSPASVAQAKAAAGDPVPAISAPLPRLAVRRDKEGRGEFYNTATGKEIYWRGTNHCRFLPGQLDKIFTTLYDAEYTENMFRQMHAAGYNVVRVFLRVEDIKAADGTATLNPAYMTNFVDFVRRAAANGVYVYLTCDWVPDAYVLQTAPTPEAEPPVQGTNLHYFSDRYIQAYGRYWQDVLRRLKAEDPALLTAIAGIDLKNEISFSLGHPFTARTGKMTVPELGTFYLSSPRELKTMADKVANKWLRKVRNMIKEVEPQVLVSASMGFVGNAETLEPERDPGAPYGLITFDLAAHQDACDFLDTHFYVMPAWLAQQEQPYTGYQDIAGSWDARKEGAARLRLDKPLVIGEIGVFRDAVGYDLAKAMWLLADFQANSVKYLNARGWLHWLWDAKGFEEFWSDQWLLTRNPENWISSIRRPDPAALPQAYAQFPGTERAPPPTPLGPPSGFKVSDGASFTQTPFGYLLQGPSGATARRMLDTPCTRRLDLETTMHYDQGQNHCAAVTIGDSVSGKSLQFQMIWDGARCRLSGNGVAAAELDVLRPPIPYDERMFSTKIHASINLTEKKLLLTFNGVETLTKELTGLDRIDFIEIVKQLDEKSHVAISKIHAE